VVVVVVEPECQLPAGIGQAEEYLHVQALIAQSSVEALDVAVLDRPPWPDEVQMYSVQISPVIHSFTGELGSVVHGMDFGAPRRATILSSAAAIQGSLRGGVKGSDERTPA